MTTINHKAAMQQALEALYVLLTEPMAKIAADKAEALLLRAAPALREALAEQAEHEPVAWARTSESGEVLDCISNKYKVTQPCTVDYDEPLYAAPVSIAKQSETDSSSSSMRTTVRTKDLTDAEIEKVWLDGHRELGEIGFARAVIAAYKEKNK